MECVICKNGTTEPGKVTVTLEKKDLLLPLRRFLLMFVEYYLSAEMTNEVLKRAEEAFEKGVEIEVIKMNSVA